MTTGEVMEMEAKQITRDVLEALVYLHGEGFTHRDVKPQVSLLQVFHSKISSLVL